MSLAWGYANILIKAFILLHYSVVYLGRLIQGQSMRINKLSAIVQIVTAAVNLSILK